MRIQPNELWYLYRAAGSDTPRQAELLEKLLNRLAGKVYPEVVQNCTYFWEGRRYWVSGGTPALREAMSAFIDFVEEFEARGTVSLTTFDAILWACHNNGTLADKFICVENENVAMELLNELGGISRG